MDEQAFAKRKDGEFESPLLYHFKSALIQSSNGNCVARLESLREYYK